MMNSRPKYRLIDNKRLPFRFLFFALYNCFLSVLILGLALFFPLIRELNNKEKGLFDMAAAANKILYVDRAFWPAVLFLFILVCLQAAYAMYKIATPLSRFERIMTKISEGDLTVNSATPKEEYLEEIETLNLLAETLRRKLAEVQNDNQALRDALAAIIEHREDPAWVKEKNTWQEVWQQSTQLTEKLNYFKV